MAEIVLLIIFEFFGPVILIGLAIWGAVVLSRWVRLKKSLGAAKDDEAVREMERLRVRAALLQFSAFGLGIVAFCVGMYVSGEFTGGLVGFALTSGPLELWARSLRRKYSAKFKSSIVAEELAKTFDNLIYEPKGVFSEERLRKLNFFVDFQSVSGSDFIEAEYKGIRFCQSDISLERKSQLTDANGNSDEHWESIFNGRVMQFDFAEAFRGPVQVIRRDFGRSRTSSYWGEWNTVETELAEFGREYKIYAKDPLDAMSVLTPQMILGIYYLNKTLGVPMAFCFEGNSMYAIMALTRDAFEISEKKTVLEEREFLKKDIALVTEFLETMYFRPQAEKSDTPAAPAANSAASTAGAAVSSVALTASSAAGSAPEGLGSESPVAESLASARPATISPEAAESAVTVSAAAESAAAGPTALASTTIGPTALTTQSDNARQEPSLEQNEPTTDYSAQYVSDESNRFGLQFRKAIFLVSLLIYVASAAYLLMRFPDGFALGYSNMDGDVLLSGEVSTLAYVLIGSIFIFPSILGLGMTLATIVDTLLTGSGSGISLRTRLVKIRRSVIRAFFIGIPLLFHLFYVNINVTYR